MVMLYSSDQLYMPGQKHTRPDTKSLECTHKSLSNYKSVNLHNVEEMRDINSWSPGSCRQVRKAKKGVDVRGKKGGKRGRCLKESCESTSRYVFLMHLGVEKTIIWFLFLQTCTNSCPIQVSCWFTCSTCLLFIFPALNTLSCCLATTAHNQPA